MDDGERLARLETLVAELREDVAEMKRGWQHEWGLLRARTHKLENDSAAAAAAQAALETARALRQQTFSKWDRIIVASCTLIAAGSALASLLLR